MSRKKLILLILVGVAGTGASYAFSMWMQTTVYEVRTTSENVVVAHSADEAFVLVERRREYVFGQRTELALTRYTPLPQPTRRFGGELTVVHVRGDSRTRRVIEGTDAEGTSAVVDGIFFWHRVDGGRWWRWNGTAFVEVDPEERKTLQSKLKPGGDPANREGWEQVRQPLGQGAAEIRVPLETQAFTVRCGDDDLGRGAKHLAVVLHPDRGPDEVLLDLKTGRRPATEAEIREIKVMTAGGGGAPTAR